MLDITGFGTTEKPLLYSSYFQFWGKSQNHNKLIFYSIIRIRANRTLRDYYLTERTAFKQFMMFLLPDPAPYVALLSLNHIARVTSPRLKLTIQAPE